MPEQKKVLLHRSDNACCMLDPEEEQQPKGALPAERLREKVGLPSTYQTNARVVKGHWRRSGS